MDYHSPPEPLRKEWGQIPAAIFNAFLLVQAPIGYGRVACLASNDAHKFMTYLFFLSLLPCCNGIASRHTRPLRIDIRAWRTGYVQREGEEVSLSIK